MLVSSYYSIPLRRFNPLVRLAISVALIVAAFTVTTLQGVVVVAVVVLLVGLVGGIAGRMARILRVVAPMLAVAFILWTFFNRYSLFHAYGGGTSVEFGIYMTVRLVALIFAPLIFISTTTPSELVASLESLRIPRGVVFLLALTLRHISGIAEEYRAIKEAQISRGLELDRGSLVRRIRNYVPVIIPLLIRCIEVADRVTLAMELKLYGGRVRSRYFRCSYSLADYLVLALVLAACMVLVVARCLAWGV